MRNRPSFEQYAAAAGMHQPGDRLQGGAFADAVAAQQSDDLAVPHFERDAVQDMTLAVKGMDFRDLQQRLGKRMRFRCFRPDCSHSAALRRSEPGTQEHRPSQATPDRKIILTPSECMGSGLTAVAEPRNDDRND